MEPNLCDCGCGRPKAIRILMYATPQCRVKVCRKRRLERESKSLPEVSESSQTLQVPEPNPHAPF